MTTLLAIDSACASCSVAVLKEGDIVASEFETMSRGQAARLVPMIEEVMAQAEVAPSQLDAIGVTVGPGAFTGIRIGLSTARAMGLALKRPVVGVTTTEAIAHYHHNPDIPLLVAVETKRADMYLQVFQAGQKRGAPTALPLDEIAALFDGEVLIAGDGADRLEPVFKSLGLSYQIHCENTHPHADAVAQIALRRLINSPPEEFDQPPGPLYIRPPDVSPPKNAAIHG